MQKPLVRTLQRPNLHDLFNWRIWKLQKTRVHLQSAMHEVQRSRTRCCPSGRGWWQPTRARRGRQTLHLPLSRRVWLQWICQRERPQEGHANKQTNKCNGPSHLYHLSQQVDYQMSVVSTHREPLGRQLREGVEIVGGQQDILLNSKEEFLQGAVPSSRTQRGFGQ